MEVVHEKRAAWADTQRILVVGDGSALGRRQHWISVLRDLVEFATFATRKLLIVDGCVRPSSAGARST
jgi:hypothetical protein